MNKQKESSEPSSISPEHLFKILLYFLESEHLPSTPGELSALPLLDSPKYRRAFLTLKEIATKTMKSGIFDKGGLDAKTRHDPYPIQGLDQFIFDLAMTLNFYEIRTEEGYPLEFQEEKFDEILEHLNVYIAILSIYKGKGEAEKFRTLVKKLKNLKKEVTAKPDKKPPVLKSKIKKEVAATFQKHVEAPRDCMAERSAQLLTKFGIPATEHGMRDYYKNK